MNIHKLKVVVCITGGIAAYKSVELVRDLVIRGAQVRVVLTHQARHFVTATTLQAISHQIVIQEGYSYSGNAMDHIEVAHWADVIVLAPATANTIAYLAQGRADKIIPCICLATQAPVIVAPAMNVHMWNNIATQENIKIIAARGYKIIGPDIGSQACGDYGPGRMLEVIDIVENIYDIYRSRGRLFGKHAVVTAGGTKEYIDPVRYISNASSGRMGIALAEALYAEGADVVLINASQRRFHAGIKCKPVVSALDMLDAAMEATLQPVDLFIGAAAVSDWSVNERSQEKIKKQENQDMSVNFSYAPDIIRRISQEKRAKFIVGFAAESSNVIEHARDKMHKKKLDMIIANDISRKDIGFDSIDNACTILTAKYEEELPKGSKREIALGIIEHCIKRIT